MRWIYMLLTLALATGAFAPGLLAQEDPAAPNARVQELFDQGWTLMGKMHEDPGNLDLAAQKYHEVLSLDSKNDDAYWKLAEVTLKKGQIATDEETRRSEYARSLMYAEKALWLNPNSAPALFMKASDEALFAEMSSMFKARGLIKSAIKDFERCIEVDPQSRFVPLSKSVLANIYKELPWPMRDLDKAEKLAQEAARQDPNLTLASVNLGQVYAKQEEWDKAQKELERCLATQNPTYIWDSVLFDWPNARKTLAEVREKKD